MADDQPPDSVPQPPAPEPPPVAPKPRRWPRRNARVLLVGVVALLLTAAGLWAWERNHRDGLWEALLRPDATYEELLAAKAGFDRYGRYFPNDPEIAVGRYLAEARLRNRSGFPDYRTSSGATYWSEGLKKADESPDWHAVVKKVRAVSLLRYETSYERDGRRGGFTGGGSEDVFAREIRPKTLPPAGRRGARIVARLEDLIRAEFIRPRDLDLLLSCDAGYTAGLSLAADQPLDRFRFALLAAVARPELRAPLERDFPSWRATAHAHEVIPDLVVWSAGPVSTSTLRGNPERAEEWLAQIDPNWAKAPEARRAIPELIVKMADGPRTAQRLEQIDPDWPRSAEARSAVGPAIERLVEVGVKYGERWDQAALNLVHTLNLVDPAWRTSPEAVRAKGQLFQLYARQQLTPWGVVSYPVYVIKSVTISTCTSRVKALLEHFGPPYNAAELIDVLPRLAGDTAFRPWVANVLAAVDPEWRQSAAGQAVRAELATLVDDPSEDIRYAARSALREFDPLPLEMRQKVLLTGDRDVLGNARDPRPAPRASFAKTGDPILWNWNWEAPGKITTPSYWPEVESPNESDWAEVDFGAAKQVWFVNVLFSSAGQTAGPPAIDPRIEYWDGTAWRPVHERPRKPAELGLTITDAGTEKGRIYAYPLAFDPVVTTKVRVTFSHAKQARIGFKAMVYGRG